MIESAFLRFCIVSVHTVRLCGKIRNMRKTAKRKMVSTLKETSKGLKNTKELIINQNEQGWLRKIETKLRNLNIFQNTSSKFHVAAGF